MSSGPDVEARRHYLEQFAYRTSQNLPPNGHETFQSPLSTVPPSMMQPQPPSQSRDATASSRYFQAGQTNGTVLVPSSSPLAQEKNARQYTPYSEMTSTSPMPNTPLTKSWSYSMNARADPLSKPSGFVTSTEVNNASSTRQISLADGRRFDDDGASDNDRPRKRPNLSVDSVIAVSPGSPPSPEIIRAGQKRKVAASRTLLSSSSISSDESLPAVSSLVAGSSKPRIARGAAPVDSKLQNLRVSHAWLPHDHVDVAYHRSNGNVLQATRLLSDPDFNPKAKPIPPVSMSVTSTPDSIRVVWKVKEVEEEREAARMHQKEIAAKSSIYKRRATVDQPSPSGSAPPPSSTVIELDSSPVRPRIVRGNPRKVIDSASEDDQSEDEIQLPRNSPTHKALDSLNTLSSDALVQLTGCTKEQAEKIVSLRPFGSVDDVQRRLGQGKKKAGPAGISPRMFSDCIAIYEGYSQVDGVLRNCECIGEELKKAIAAWSGKGKGKAREGSLSSDVQDGSSDDGAISLVSISNTSSSGGFINKASSLLAKGVQLKDYQIIGVNWLRLLHSRRYSCILADEMGLGKTVQVISFFSQLKEEGCQGPHLIVVPSSTLENWCREFDRFAPSIAIQTYYGGKDDRFALREHLLATQIGKRSKQPWEVLITTYQLAVGEHDRKFFRKIPWNTCVFDEGHQLKNFQSQRYNALTRIDAVWKLLLTGTPLQNNLQELVSVMKFILPDQFSDQELDSLRSIFKVKGDTKQLLAEERVKRAKTMMTPFVLRRRKDQVLKDLPKKSERIEWCIMSALQKKIYNDARKRSRNTVIESVETEADGKDKASAYSKPTESKVLQKKGKNTTRAKDKKYSENSTNVLMELRKAASHPMLFRNQFTDSILTSIARALLKEPDFKERKAVFQLVKEDMEVMTDAELQGLAGMYKSTQKFLLDDECYVNSGKTSTMLSLLDRYIAEGRKCLIFSQFTQILDILQVILKQRTIKHLILTGSTAVDVRQGLVDEFTDDPTIPVFLLSTKAGGMGINLTAASVVILFDQDFNPHNDKQAADRAYRIGQKRDVEIVKLISRGTIEEDMLRLGETKLALDEAVSGDAEEGDAGDAKAEKVMRQSLMERLRKQFEEEDLNGSAESPAPDSKTGASTRAAIKASTKAIEDSDGESDLTDLEAS